MSVILGDSLDELKNINDNSIDLIYLDPPFFTQKTQKSKNKDNTKDNISNLTCGVNSWLFEL